MSLSRQHTIQKEVEVAGRGLFTGFPVRARFRPAPIGSGVTFVRTDQPEPVRINARYENLTKRARRTSLRNGSMAVETVEHCLAAIRGMDIDNVEVELDNAELPAGDGSSMPFVSALTDAGVAEQDAERVVIRITEPLHAVEGDAELVIWPGDDQHLEVIYELDYGPNNAIGRQFHHYKVSADSFPQEIAPARTFVTESEAAELRAAGLGTHLQYQDILVIGRDGPIENEFRFPNECVRHKILDLVGDLMLAGAFVCGKVYARKSGHSLNHELVHKIREWKAAEEMRARLGGAKLDVRAVQRILPHRFPMLMVDRVIEIQGDRRVVGVKNVTINEPFFQGHYPNQPIFPGVMIIEALAQLGGILFSQKLEHTGKVAVLLSLDRAKFRRPVVPGDQLLLEVEAVRVKSRTGEIIGRATVQNELAAEATIRFMLVDAGEF